MAHAGRSSTAPYSTFLCKKVMSLWEKAFSFVSRRALDAQAAVPCHVIRCATTPQRHEATHSFAYDARWRKDSGMYVELRFYCAAAASDSDGRICFRKALSARCWITRTAGTLLPTISATSR